MEIEELTQVPHNILQHAIKTKIEFLEVYGLYQLTFSVFFQHYVEKVTLEEIAELKTDDRKNLYKLFQSKWINCVSQFHDDLIQGKTLRELKESDAKAGSEL